MNQKINQDVLVLDINQKSIFDSVKDTKNALSNIEQKILSNENLYLKRLIKKNIKLGIKVGCYVHCNHLITY